MLGLLVCLNRFRQYRHLLCLVVMMEDLPGAVPAADLQSAQVCSTSPSGRQLSQRTRSGSAVTQHTCVRGSMHTEALRSNKAGSHGNTTLLSTLMQC